VLLVVIAAAVVPMWISTAHMGLTGHGYAAVFLMIVFMSLVGGGLMFLIFFSARRGYDEAAHLHHERPPRDESQPR
jgi:hypothetical protein